MGRRVVVVANLVGLFNCWEAATLVPTAIRDVVLLEVEVAFEIVDIDRECQNFCRWGVGDAAVLR